MDSVIKQCATYYVPFGRIIVGTYFILSGLPLLINFDQAATTVESHGFPFPLFFAIGAGLLQVVGGIAIMVNRYATAMTLALAAFVLVVSVSFHGPQLWDTPQLGQLQRDTFLKNMGLMGALLFMAAHLNVTTCSTKQVV